MFNRNALKSITPIAAALLAVTLAACGGEDARAGLISRQRFIDANIALRVIPDTAAKADSLRAAVLKKHKVTEKDLTAFLAQAQRDPEELAKVWTEIAEAVDREVAKRDSVELARNPPPPPPPPVTIDPNAVGGPTLLPPDQQAPIPINQQPPGSPGVPVPTPPGGVPAPPPMTIQPPTPADTARKPPRTQPPRERIRPPSGRPPDTRPYQLPPPSGETLDAPVRPPSH